ncbi:acyl-CoA carboxylase epsilon subunit [Rhodococcus sp. NPDC003322]
MTAVLETADVELDEAAMLGTPVPQQDPIRFSGNPDDTEIAAVLVALAAVSGAPAAAEPQTEEGWGSPAQMMRYGLSAAPSTFVNARYAR